ncbi:SUMF1/EgtB/PvdO family nonheme iron enzyme [Bacteroides hominis]|uniref:SUMF1/EgtB/PvdO family nonheme iron enzyme n=1 Tax=Bacteroides hominis TaxID=2763023 RepID=UPI00164A1EDF|nr:SUMF1/EgtB/PvdO family nonheme iron enzyme [Bacteroides hominis (ex Liu et al. 2022)]MBC5614551.1 SUMF1/EgtB/PvdO family nonheme iron enzyme [Bacteroides hominis (ex Liu et al. 2022)]
MRILKNFRQAARTLLGGVLLAGLLFAGGCSRDDNFGPGGASDVAVSFTAGIEQAAMPATTAAGVPQTRTTNGGDSWLTTDAVGIFMLTAGGTLPGNIVSGTDNVRYAVTDASTGALSGGPVYYPQSGNVDFVAYYPHGTVSTGAAAGTVNTTDYTYNISLVGQTDAATQNTLDVLYARKANIAKSGTAVNLAFGHVLSKVTLNVKAGEGIAQADIQNLAASAVVFGGMPVTATLALQDGRLTAGAVGSFNPVKAATATAAYDATFTALVVPQNGTAGRTMVFTVGGKTYTGPIPDTDAFRAGKHYIYPVTVSRTGVIVGTPDISPWDKNDRGTGDVTEIGADIEWAKIPAGTFLMGSPMGEPERKENETQHEVTLTKDFYMSKYEITNAQYAKFLNSIKVGKEGKFIHENYPTGQYQGFVLVVDCTTSGHSEWGVKWDDTNSKWVPVSGYENHPVINVSWYGAYEYAAWVGGSLPTEAQWEYACRGGQTESLPFGIGDGRKLIEGMANYELKYSYNGGEFVDNEAYKRYTPETKAVGSYSYANGYGLYDMHGNVIEWCSDWYDEDYDSANVTDPAGPETGSERVYRGGHWGTHARSCRSAYRNSINPELGGNVTGFRVVVVP